MSRIGKRILQIPSNVEVQLAANNTVTIKGPKGEMTQQFKPAIKITVADGTVRTTRSSEQKMHKALHGTTNALINNMLQGVAHGYEKTLIISGVGFKASMKGQVLHLNLGFSHPIEYHAPSGVSISVPKPTVVRVNGIDKQLVAETAAQIRAFRKPEPYKGKGIKYLKEVIIRKEGKAAGK